MESSTQYSHNIHGLNQRFGPGTLVSPEDMGDCQNYGPFLGPLN